MEHGDYPRMPSGRFLPRDTLSPKFPSLGLQLRDVSLQTVVGWKPDRGLTLKLIWAPEQPTICSARKRPRYATFRQIKGPLTPSAGPLLNLRISVTDRCNLRCRYCMPEEEYGWLPREKMLSFEEISELAEIFTEVGIEKVRLTGGEPLLRKDLPVLVRMLAQNPRIRDLALTTNGVLLAGQAQALWDAGLHRLAVSLDTLRPDRFLVLTRRNAHAPVLRGIEAARQAGFRALKIDAVVVRGTNEDELADLIEFGKRPVLKCASSILWMLVGRRSGPGARWFRGRRSWMR